MMNRPFLMGVGGNAISTPHTLWSKNRFLSTRGKRIRFGGCAGGLSGIFVCCREVGSHGNLSHDKHGLGDWAVVSGGVGPRTNRSGIRRPLARTAIDSPQPSRPPRRENGNHV